MKKRPSLRDDIDVVCAIEARRIKDDATKRGEVLSDAKALVRFYQTPRGRELLELKRHRDSWLPADEFKAAQSRKVVELPKHVAAISEVRKRAQAMVDAGTVPTIEQARVAVRRADRDLAERERVAFEALQS